MYKKGFIILILAIFSILIFDSGSVNAANCGGDIQCNCGDTLTSSHNMTYDLNNCPGHGIVIGASNIILDCKGHRLLGNDAPNSFGVYINGPTYTKIKNCRVQDFESGITISGYYNLIEKNIITGTVAYGILVIGSSSSNVIWKNNLTNNANAYETGINNYWDNGTIGNYWSDFNSNPGYPNTYIIPGPGNGIDYYPNKDSDGDGVWDGIDNCPNNYNPTQLDSDNDGIGDACDNCINNQNPNQEDIDNDQVGDLCDNCQNDYNPNQEDVDNDRVGNICDNCPNDYNPNQEDYNNNGVGDVCDVSGVDFEINQEDILFSDDTPLRGETVTITALFHNLLEDDPEEVLVRFYSAYPSNETFIGEQLVIIQNPLTSTFFAQTEWTPEVDDFYDIYVWIDPENEISEPNEENNIAFRPIHVRTKPDIRIRDSDIGFTNNHPVHGETIQILAMVRNIENEPTGPFMVRFYDEVWTNLIGEAEMSLNGLETDVVMIPWNATFGLHNITVYGDSTLVIEEWNETNNRGNKTINVIRVPGIKSKQQAEQYPG